ncbi:MAG TPA: hypothetical protein VGG03_21395 [Thermoanaerobaculia bacterium]|jgi:hypothetical protein
MELKLSDWADMATIAASVVAVFALLYTAVQVRSSTKVSGATFWLQLRMMFSEHKEIHSRLRNREWPVDDNNLPEDKDWIMLESYMGLLEHCETMLEKKLIDWPTFDSIYSYRVLHIVRNPLIVREKLIRRRYGWGIFLRLLKRVQSKLPQRKYLYGIWSSDERNLWLGYVHEEEIHLQPRSWTELEGTYFQIFNDLKARPGGLHYAWLVKDGKLEHRWCIDDPGDQEAALPDLSRHDGESQS